MSASQGWSAERNFAASKLNWTAFSGTTVAIINSVTVANIESVGSAESPDCRLNEPREYLWISSTIPAGVDLGRGELNDGSAAVWLVTFGSVGVPRIEAVEDTSAMQPVVDQGVDDNQPGARSLPDFGIGPSAEQQYD